MPADKNVTAGWTALAIFIGLAWPWSLLGFSLTRHLRKARENADKGASTRAPSASPDGQPLDLRIARPSAVRTSTEAMS